MRTVARVEAPKIAVSTHSSNTWAWEAAYLVEDTSIVWRDVVCVQKETLLHCKSNSH